MFMTEGCEETENDEIVIKDASANVIEALIKYMHLRSVEKLEKIAVDLFKAADKYQVEGLKVGFLKIVICNILF